MKLFREISLGSSTLIVIGNIVGVGIFTTSGLLVAQLGSTPWLMGVWLVGGGLALIGALCYSLLARDTPKAGGEYAFLYPVFGPLTAFYSGWASLLIGFSAPIAAASIGLATYADALLPFSTTSSPLALKATSLAILLAVTCGTSLGLSFGTRLHSLVTVFNIILLLGFAGLCLYASTPSPHLATLFGGPARGDGPPLTVLGSSIIFVMFAYSGWNAAAYVAEEVRDPRINIPVALLSGTVAVIVAYLLINLAYFSAVPLPELSGKIAVAEVAAKKALGAWGSGLVSLLIGTSIVSSLTAMSIAGPRVYFAMARDGLLPFSLSQVDPHRKIPFRAIWFQAGVAFVLILVAQFQQILLSAGVVMVFFTTVTVATLLRRRDEQGGSGIAFLLLRRLLPLIFVGANAAILVSAAITHTTETIAGLIAVLSGTPVFLVYRKRRPSSVPGI